VPKDKLAFIAIPLVPLQIFLPIVIGKYTAGPTPLNIYLKAYPYRWVVISGLLSRLAIWYFCRILMGIVFAVVVFVTPSFQQADGHYPFVYYLMIIAVYCLHQVNLFVSISVFYSFHKLIKGRNHLYLHRFNLHFNFEVFLPLRVFLHFICKLCL